MINKNIHIYPSSLNNQSRILKEFKTLIDNNLVNSIVYIGTWKEVDGYKGELDSRIKLVNIEIPLKTGINSLDYFIKYFVFILRAIRYLRKEKFDVINCHNLSVLPIGVYFRKRRNIKLIYDAHELETEVEGAVGVKKKFGKYMEKRAMTYIDSMIVVSHSIKNWYEKQYNVKRISVVRNIPFRNPINNQDRNFLKDKLKIPQNNILFIYQGLLSEVRGIDEILNAFKETNTSKHILFLGNGPMSADIQKLNLEYPNIHWHKSVSSIELPIYTSGADVGIHLIKNSCLNHYYCSPNKIFEYLLSGIPQIISNFPDMSVVLNDGKCGWGIEPNQLELKKLIETLTFETIEEKRENVKSFRENFGWQLEEKNILEVYKQINSD